MSFQIHALPPAPFEQLFDLSDEELTKFRASRMLVDAEPGFPCRVSLADAAIGEQVILINYQHQAAESPYQATHAIFVRENAQQAFPDVGSVPEQLESRLISIRAFDDKHHMVDADVVDGFQLKEVIPTVFQDRSVRYLHLHNAKRGCFAAKVTRA